MSARTLAGIFFIAAIAVPSQVRATASIIGQYSGVAMPYTTAYNPGIDVATPATLVATGTLTSVVLPLASTRGISGTDRISVRMQDYYFSRWLDCQTGEKTVDELGITLTIKDPNAPPVTLGPFTGTQCDIVANIDGMQDRTLVFLKNGVPDGTLAAMGTGYHYNWTAYGPDVPATSTPPVDPCSLATCVDSVLFLPGLEASRLYMRTSGGSERELWEPSIYTDVPELALNADGTSVNQVYTRDVVDTLYGNTALRSAVSTLLGLRAEVYGSFHEFLDGLAASSTLRMTEWRDYPYDWRFDVRDIVEQGTLTDAHGTLQTVYPVQVVTDMASSSATGKVTIVAHSNGGLLAKALIDALEALGKANLVSRLITVGTPHWGTPTDIGALLHGDGGTRGLGLITYAESVREAGKTMPGTYGLLPSTSYFGTVANPVVTFEGGGLTEGYKSAFGSGISSFSDLSSFLADTRGLNGSVGDSHSLNVPLVLAPDLIAEAGALHSSFDAWTPPAGIAVTSIAGWGQLTTYGYRYEEAEGHRSCHWEGLERICTREKILIHTALKTEDGDDTVIDASAVANVSDKYYLNTKEIQFSAHIDFSHQNLTAADQIQNLIQSLLTSVTVEEDHISASKPVAVNSPLTRVGGRSPINIVIADELGHRTGILSIPGVDGIYADVQEIPGSAVDASGDEKYVYVPSGSSYTVTVDGYGDGMANIEIASVDRDGNVTETTTIADLPVTSSSVGSLTMSGAETLSAFNLDSDGNGTIDVTVTPAAGKLTPYEVPTEAAGAGSVDPNWTMVFEEPARPALQAAPATTTMEELEEVQATTTPLRVDSNISVEPEPSVATATPAQVTVQKPTLPRPAQADAKATAEKAVPQVAAVYEGISSATRSGFGDMLYHWMVRTLRKVRSVFSVRE